MIRMLAVMLLSSAVACGPSVLAAQAGGAAQPEEAHACTDYYYGIGVPRSATKAFQCFQDSNDYIWLILMTLNGEGTRQSPRQASELLAKAGLAEPEEEGLGVMSGECCEQNALEAAGSIVGDPDMPFTGRGRLNICDFAGGTAYRDPCLLDFENVVLEPRHDAEFAPVEAKFNPAAKASMAEIEKIFADLKLADGNWKYEEYIGGSGRGTFAAWQQMLDEYDFAALRRKILTEHALKARTEAEFRTRNKELNDDYEALGKDENGGRSTYFEPLRDAERLWIKLEDPWKRLCEELYRGEMPIPDIDRAIATALRGARILELDEEKQNQQHLDFFEADVPEFEHFDRGDQRMDDKDWDSAIREYREVIRLSPGWAVAHRSLAGAMAKQGDWDGAIHEYTEAIRLNPEDGEAYRERGSALQNKKDFDGAIRDYRQALALYPKWPVPHTALAAVFESKEDWKSAIVEAREIVRQKPDDNEAHRELGEDLNNTQDWDGAIAEFGEAIRLRPGNAAAHAGLAWSFENEKDWDGAIAEYRKAIDLFLPWPSGRRHLAWSLEEKGDLDSATAEYRETIRLQQDDPDAHGGLGWVLERKKDWAGAIREFREAIRLRPGWAQVHNNLADALLGKGDPDGSIAEAREALRLKPDLAGAHVNIGNALAAKGDRDGAIAEFGTAIRMEPGYVNAHGNLASTLGDKGDWDGAVTEYREVARLTPGDPVAHSSLGDALEHRGDHSGALEEYRKAIELDPKNADIRDAYEKLLVKPKG